MCQDFQMNVTHLFKISQSVEAMRIMFTNVQLLLKFLRGLGKTTTEMPRF